MYFSILLKSVESHLNESLYNAVIPYNAMKLYVYIFKRLDLKCFENFKNITSNCRPQFSDFFRQDNGYFTEY